MQADYIIHMGSDLMVANAARVSMNKESAWEILDTDQTIEHPFGKPVLSQADAKLIGYLSKNGHWTPFAHPQITMRETVPIFVARQRFKHVVGFVYNEVSRRYVDDTPDFHVPESWRSRPAASIKQGSGSEEITKVWLDGEISVAPTDVYKQFLDQAEALYSDLIDSGVAPEQARMVLPQSMMTSYYVTGSLAAWARMYKLRADPHAQKEIRDLAVQWGEIIRPLFPVSWAALTS